MNERRHTQKHSTSPWLEEVLEMELGEALVMWQFCVRHSPGRWTSEDMKMDIRALRGFTH